MTTVAGKTVLVTGANRGIGRALLDEALARGASRVYAGTRQPLAIEDERVIPLTLDLTDPEQIRQAADQVHTLDVLVNNAAVAAYDDLSDRTAIQAHLEVNLFGTYDLTQALLPALIESGGTIVNVLSIAALASLPMIPSYSISKAATLSLTQSMRALLAPQNVRVHAVLVGPTDTEMSRGLEVPKVSPEYVAQATFDGLEHGIEDIFPHPMLEPLAAEAPTSQVKTLEHQFASFVAAV